MVQPASFGRYTVKKTLGRGAMGVVYLAEDPVIGREVAVKAIVATQGVSEGQKVEIQARFEREFRSAGTLSHPNIVTIHDVGKQGDASFIAMEYVRGESLQDVLVEQQVLSFKDVSDLAYQISSGLDYAHERGIVHRDIKPANILITHDGQAKITDFGVAKLASTTLTRTGTIIGTPAYMSPEQVQGHVATAASDQFSVAILVYEMLTGELPFPGESPTTIMYKIVHEEPVRPHELNRKLPEGISRVLVKALDKNPDRRYRTCTELAEAVRGALGAAPPEATIVYAPPRPEETVRQAKEPRGRWLVSLAGGVLIVGLAAILWVQLGPTASLPLPDTGGSSNAPAAGGGTDPAAGPGAAGAAGAAAGGGASGAETAANEGTEDDAAGGAPGGEEPGAAGATAGGETADAADTAGAADATPGAAAEAPQLRRFTILSRPEGATVSLDGDRVAGVTPLEVELEPDRDYRLEVTLDGHETASFPFGLDDLSAEQLASGELYFPLESSAPPAVLVVSARYPVEMVVGGRTYEIDGRQDVEIAAGTYPVTLRSDAVFYRDQRTVEVEAGGRLEIPLPPTYTISVIATPVGSRCRVTIDGVEAGFAPLSNLTLTGGDHEFRFEWTAPLQETRTEIHRVTREGQRIVAAPAGAAR